MKGLYLREVDYTDMDLLFTWANDRTVRDKSFSIESIPYEDHVKWFKRMMESDSVLQFIMVSDDLPIGQIRLNVDNDVAEIGYSIAKEHRGKGYGHRILQLLVDILVEQHPEITKLVAKVKPDNVASNKLFQSEGYEMQYSCYVREINRKGK